MIKHIIREVDPEAADFRTAFDNDAIHDYDGQHFDYNLFILSYGFYGRIDSGFNLDDYRETVARAESIIDGFGSVERRETDYNGDLITYADILDDEDIPADYLPELLYWYNNDPDINKPADIAIF